MFFIDKSAVARSKHTKRSQVNKSSKEPIGRLIFRIPCVNTRDYVTWARSVCTWTFSYTFAMKSNRRKEFAKSVTPHCARQRPPGAPRHAAATAGPRRKNVGCEKFSSRQSAPRRATESPAFSRLANWRRPWRSQWLGGMCKVSERAPRRRWSGRRPRERVGGVGASWCARETRPAPRFLLQVSPPWFPELFAALRRDHAFSGTIALGCTSWTVFLPLSPVPDDEIVRDNVLRGMRFTLTKRFNKSNVMFMLFASQLTESFSSHPRLFEKVLPIYYTVIVWDGTDQFKSLLARKYFIVVQLRSRLLC